MKTRIITTNLRIPEEDLSLTRAMAQSSGISTNEYMKKAIKQATYADYFAMPEKKKMTVFEALIKLSKMKTKGPKGEFSEEDKAIYDP